ncbi:MAG TPA: hypothetical protein VMD28_06630 [Acidimicrobiales bacterium]|nr:hypothetical protein [Acidimicrobiales bacterium]
MPLGTESIARAEVRRRQTKSRAGALALVALALGAAACGGGTPASDGHAHRSGNHGTTGTPHSTTKTSSTTQTTGLSTTATSPSSTTRTTGSATTTTTPSSTVSPSTTVAPAPPRVVTAHHGPVTEPPLPLPGPGFVPDKVTAVGDSVMLDYAGALAQDIPGVQVTAAVSRWWTTGEAVIQRLKSQDELGAVVIVGLGTNGPVSAAQFASMMSVLSGASRVVFVNNRVDRTWQDANNAVLAQGVARYRRAVLVNWYALAVQHASWFYTTQTHLPIDGPGADALAALVAAAA